MSSHGIPWNANVVANLETGRRAILSVDELLVAAYVLGVPPFSLLLPSPSSHIDEVAITPTVSASWYDTALWLVGEGLVSADQKASMRGSVGWGQAIEPINAIRRLRTAAEEEHKAYDQLLTEELRHDNDRLTVARRLHQRAFSEFYSALVALAHLGVKPPPLPARLAEQIRTAGFSDVPPEVEAMLGGGDDAKA